MKDVNCKKETVQGSAIILFSGHDHISFRRYDHRILYHVFCNIKKEFVISKNQISDIKNLGDYVISQNHLSYITKLIL